MNYEFIYVTNYRQACAYISDNVKPCNIFYDKERKTMVFVFRKKDTNIVWQKWMHGEYRPMFNM